MRLVPDVRRVVLLSLSFWMQVFGLAVLILPELWYGQDYDPNVAWWLAVGLLLAGIIGRVFQQGISPWKEWLRIAAVAAIVFALALLLAWPSSAATLPDGPATEAQTLAIAVPFIAKEEGKRNHAYRDAVGKWTICSGSTRGVHANMMLTDEQCLDLLKVEGRTPHRAAPLFHPRDDQRPPACNA
ncbi:MAG: lysozyme [Mesorhizobium sp.]|nr:MAG: lysozyme [Mesorhizobium sp.]